jgi:hypothetical protein
VHDVVAIGVTLGLGVAFGLLAAAVVAAWKYGLVASVGGGLVLGLVVGVLLKGWIGVPGAVAGPLLGAVSASLVARGALRRGATPGGTAFLLGSAAIALGALAFIPLAGYVIAAIVPGVAVRRARREPERFAGLRTLAK